MARRVDRLPHNVEGNFWVDSSCIDCDTCRWLAPETFARAGDVEKSFVGAQPSDAPALRRAAMAVIACPTASIGADDKESVRAASGEFPEPIEGEVHYCGFASERSFGAASYLAVRAPTRGGNVLVDSPRVAKPLLRRIEEMGGVATMFLSHRDDVADHARFREVFGCARVMHQRDLGPSSSRSGASTDTAGIEHAIEGDLPIRLDDDLLAIPVPGHTRGSVALLYREHFLFTGDHLWWSETRRALHASRSVCWSSWSDQTESMERLLDFRFEWVLPGHGRRWHAPSAAAMREEIERLVRRMRKG